jgi:hypothetical protein
MGGSWTLRAKFGCGYRPSCFVKLSQAASDVLRELILFMSGFNRRKFLLLPDEAVAFLEEMGVALVAAVVDNSVISGSEPHRAKTVNTVLQISRLWWTHPRDWPTQAIGMSSPAISMQSLLAPGQEGSLEHARVPADGHRVTWLTQCDPLILAGSLVTICIGAGWLADPTIRQETRNERDNLKPLVAFGVASVVAWTSTRRAVFRIASMEASAILSSRGVRQRELSDMLEMKMPSVNWLR